MSQGVQLTAEEPRQVQMDVPRALDRLCREHGPSYFRAFGTLIAALRHEGFTPWDDDIDVYMPRRDYERLHELCHSGALPEHLALSSYRERTVYPFVTLVDSDMDLNVLSEEDLFPARRVRFEGGDAPLGGRGPV